VRPWRLLNPFAWARLHSLAVHRPAILLCVGVAVAVTVVFAAALSRSPTVDETGYSVENWPGLKWQMFSETSPWVAHHRKPRVAPGSAAMIGNMIAEGPPSPWDRSAGENWGIPLYFGRSVDPRYTLKLTETRYDFEREINGTKIHVPSDAQPSTGSDRTMNIVDQPSGYIYHLTRVQIDQAARAITAWRSHRLKSGGVGFHLADEPPTGNAAIRPEELAAGYVRHTMMLEVSYLSGHPVAPYDKSVTLGKTGPGEGSPGTNRLSIGNVVFLDMTHAEVDALADPIWQKAILHGLIDHGAVVAFNGGAPWALIFESPLDRTSLGMPDPYTTAGLPSTLDYSHALDAVGGWGAKLKVLAPIPRPCNDTEPGCSGVGSSQP
jgi:hypothetical protein